MQIVFGRLDVVRHVDSASRTTRVPRAIFLNGATIGLLYGLLGMGLILVYRANRIINFAQAQLGSVPAVDRAAAHHRARTSTTSSPCPVVIIGGALLGAARRGADHPPVHGRAPPDRHRGDDRRVAAAAVLRVPGAERGSPATLVSSRPASRRRGPASAFDVGPAAVHRRLLRRRRRHRRHLRRPRRLLPLHRHGHRRAGVGRERRAGVAARHPGATGCRRSCGSSPRCCRRSPCSCGRR